MCLWGRSVVGLCVGGGGLGFGGVSAERGLGMCSGGGRQPNTIELFSGLLTPPRQIQNFSLTRPKSSSHLELSGRAHQVWLHPADHGVVLIQVVLRAVGGWVQGWMGGWVGWWVGG